MFASMIRITKSECDRLMLSILFLFGRNRKDVNHFFFKQPANLRAIEFFFGCALLYPID